MITELLDIYGGWYPRIAPDGQRVCFGAGKLGFALTIKGALPNWVVQSDAYQGGWHDRRTIYYLNSAGLCAYDVVALQPRLVKAGVLGNTFDVTEGHWAACRHGIGELTWDGTALAKPGRSGVSSWGDHVVTTVNPGVEQPRWPFEHWVAGARTRTFTPDRGRTNEFRLGHLGWLGFGFSSRGWVASPDNPPVYHDLSVAPDPSPDFPSGEGAIVVFERGGALWALNAASVDERHFMALRRLDDPSRYIEIPWGAVRPVAHVETSGAILVAGNIAEGGRMKLFRVVPETAPWKTARQVPATPTRVPRYQQPMWHGYFFEVSQRYGTEDAASNCQVIVESGLRSVATKPVIIAREADTGVDLIDEWRSDWGRVAAVYVAAEVENNAKALQSAVTAARERMYDLNLPRRPILTYSSANYWPEVTADVVGVECYPSSNDPAALVADAKRWRATLRKVYDSGKRIALITADYDRAGRLSEETLLRAQWIYDDLAREFSTRYVLRFSHGRPGGTRDHRVLEPWHAAVDAAATAPLIETLPWPKPPQPNPEPPKPEPPSMRTLTLLAFTKKYVCAELAGHLIADRDKAQGWETFKVWSVGDKVVLQTDHGSYVTADIDGTFRFSSQYPSPEATADWEKFTIERGEGGGIAIRTFHGTLMTVNDDATVTHKARESAGINETFNLSSGGSGGGGGSTYGGALTMDGRVAKTANGADYIMRGATSFRLAHMEASNEDITPVVGELKGLGYNLVRVLTTARFLFNLPPSVGRAVLRQVLGKLRAMEMYVEVVALADSDGMTRAEMERHLHEVYAIANEFEHTMVEGANEIGPKHSTQSSLAGEIVKAFRPNGRAPYCPGSVHGGESCKDHRYLTKGQIEAGQEKDEWPDWDEVVYYAGTYGNTHLQRRADTYDRVRRTREVEASSNLSRVYFVDAEPEGADEVRRVGKRDTDPGAFFTQGVLSRIFRVGSIFHYECGLRSELLKPVQLECAKAFITGTRIVPDDVRLVYKNSGWTEPEAPVKSFTGAVRVYSGMSPGINITAAVGFEPHLSIQTQHGWRLGEVLGEYGRTRVYRTTK